MEAREKHLISFLYSPPLSLRPASLWTWALNFSEPQWSFCLYPPLGSVYRCIHNTQHAFGYRLVLMIALQVLLTIESYLQSFALRSFLAWLGWPYEWHPQSKSLLYFFPHGYFFIPVALFISVVFQAKRFWTDVTGTDMSVYSSCTGKAKELRLDSHHLTRSLLASHRLFPLP